MPSFPVWLACATAIASPFAAKGNAAPTTAVNPTSASPAASTQVQTVLPAGTPVFVMLNQELTTTTSRVGDVFQVTVLHDVLDGAIVVIPQGTIGHGEVTFATGRGGFGKAGIIGIALRYLQLGDRKVALDGHYREEGQNRNGATVATWFAVGIFSGFIKGDSGAIPRGRELKARTGEAIAYASDASLPLIPVTIAAPAIRAGDAPSVTASPATSAHLSRAEPTPSGTLTTPGGKE